VREFALARSGAVSPLSPPTAPASRTHASWPVWRPRAPSPRSCRRQEAGEGYQRPPSDTSEPGPAVVASASTRRRGSEYSVRLSVHLSRARPAVAPPVTAWRSPRSRRWVNRGCDRLPPPYCNASALPLARGVAGALSRGELYRRIPDGRRPAQDWDLTPPEPMQNLLSTLPSTTPATARTRRDRRVMSEVVIRVNGHAALVLLANARACRLCSTFPPYRRGIRRGRFCGLRARSSAADRLAGRPRDKSSPVSPSIARTSVHRPLSSSPPVACTRALVTAPTHDPSFRYHAPQGVRAPTSRTSSAPRDRPSRASPEKLLTARSSTRSVPAVLNTIVRHVDQLTRPVKRPARALAGSRAPPSCRGPVGVYLGGVAAGSPTFSCRCPE